MSHQDKVSELGKQGISLEVKNETPEQEKRRSWFYSCSYHLSSFPEHLYHRGWHIPGAQGILNEP